MAKKRNIVRAYHRTSPVAMGKRLRAYPLQSWLDEGEELVAVEGEDYTVTRQIFQQDLHNLARKATTMAFANKEEEGWIVRTSTDDLPKTEMAFCFLRCPFDECPSFRKPHEKKPTRQERAEKARDAYFCENMQPPHVCGDMIGCPVCDPCLNKDAPPPSIQNGKAYMRWLQQEVNDPTMADKATYNKEHTVELPAKHMPSMPPLVNPEEIQRTPEQELMLGVPLTAPAPWQNPPAPEWSDPEANLPLYVLEVFPSQPNNGQPPLDYTPFNPTPPPQPQQPQPLTPEQQAFSEFQEWQAAQAKLNGSSGAGGND